MRVVAPRDAEKKRPGFFIMRNKEITGSIQPDGRGVQFLYMSDGRIVSGARIIGGIQDEEMLSMLVKTEDFRKLVYSIGVTVEMEEPEEVEFAFQMYGKRDPYGSGTTIRRSVRADGMEAVIRLEEVDWSEDDDVIGQIRFEMKEAGRFAKVSVRLYLMDGYTAPEPEPEEEVNFSSENYRNMCRTSVLQKGNLARLKRALCRAKAGESITVAYLGGSITQGAGAIPIHTECYAYQSFLGLCRLLGKKPEELVYCKAGVGGTPSELGMLRYERDVLRDGTRKPDIVIVEFAVNDEGDETKGECYESLVRKILGSDGEPAVILLFSVFADDYNLQERLAPVGRTYDLPMVSVKDCVVPQFYDREHRIIRKSQYFYDCYHPTNLGHRVMADCLLTLFDLAYEELTKEVNVTDRQTAAVAVRKPLKERKLEEIAPYYGREFERVYLADRKDRQKITILSEGDFTEQDEELQAVEMDQDLVPTKEFPYNWKHTGGSRPFVMEAECSALLLINKDSASPRAGIAEVFVDGEKVRSINPRLNGWTHCNPLICFRGREKKRYHIEIAMQPGDEDKEFTILGFGLVDGEAGNVQG